MKIKWFLLTVHWFVYQVYIIGHVPPGVFEKKRSKPWYMPKFNKKYLELIQKHHSVILGQFFGHHHTDSFRMFYNSEGKSGCCNTADATSLFYLVLRELWFTGIFFSFYWLDVPFTVYFTTTCPDVTWPCALQKVVINEDIPSVCTGSPLSTMFLSPGVTPWETTLPGVVGGANNPGIRVFEYDTQTLLVKVSKGHRQAIHL